MQTITRTLAITAATAYSMNFAQVAESQTLLPADELQLYKLEAKLSDGQRAQAAAIFGGTTCDVQPEKDTKKEDEVIPVVTEESEKEELVVTCTAAE